MDLVFFDPFFNVLGLDAALILVDTKTMHARLATSSDTGLHAGQDFFEQWSEKEGDFFQDLDSKLPHASLSYFCALTQHALCVVRPWAHPEMFVLFLFPASVSLGMGIMTTHAVRNLMLQDQVSAEQAFSCCPTFEM